MPLVILSGAKGRASGRAVLQTEECSVRRSRGPSLALGMTEGNATLRLIIGLTSLLTELPPVPIRVWESQRERSRVGRLRGRRDSKQ
jgi:hypothetical protein